MIHCNLPQHHVWIFLSQIHHMVVMLHVLVPIQAFIYVAQVSSLLICPSTFYTLFSIKLVTFSVSDDATRS